MKIGILLSGGIDSMMAAQLLQEQGHEVSGITMLTETHFDPEPARQAAQWLGIAHKIVDLRPQFQKYVIDDFCTAYAHGKTPNPCIVCNQYVKLGALLTAALQMGCEKVASGHYAQIRWIENEKKYALYRGADNHKEQSYFLYRLPQPALAKLIFPLGNYTKSRVYEMAQERNFPDFVTQKKESQEICFIPSDYRDFLSGKIISPGGNFTDENGHILGQHHGIAWYTIGQRKGLGISASHPLYVLKLDAEKNEVVLGKNEQLFHSALALEQCVWLTDALPTSIQVKIRYAASPTPVQSLNRDGKTAQVQLKSPQRAITPGQSAVFYDQDRVLGGGIIR